MFMETHWRTCRPLPTLCRVPSAKEDAKGCVTVTRKQAVEGGVSVPTWTTAASVAQSRVFSQRGSTMLGVRNIYGGLVGHGNSNRDMAARGCGNGRFPNMVTARRPRPCRASASSGKTTKMSKTMAAMGCAHVRICGLENEEDHGRHALCACVYYWSGK